MLLLLLLQPLLYQLIQNSIFVIIVKYLNQTVSSAIQSVFILGMLRRLCRWAVSWSTEIYLP
jgi:hypothetical protein